MNLKYARASKKWKCAEEKYLWLLEIEIQL